MSAPHACAKRPCLLAQWSCNLSFQLRLPTSPVALQARSVRRYLLVIRHMPAEILMRNKARPEDEEPTPATRLLFHRNLLVRPLPTVGRLLVLKRDRVESTVFPPDRPGETSVTAIRHPAIFQCRRPEDSPLPNLRAPIATTLHDFHHRKGFAVILRVNAVITALPSAVNFNCSPAAIRLS